MKITVDEIWKRIDYNKVLNAWALYVIADNQRNWKNLPKVQLSLPLQASVKINPKIKTMPPDRRQGKPLFASGKLFRSLTYKVTGEKGVSIGTNVPYARDHWEGNTVPIAHVMRKMWIVKYGLLVYAKKVKLVKREFLNITEKHIEKLGQILQKELMK